MDDNLKGSHASMPTLDMIANCPASYLSFHEIACVAIGKCRGWVRCVPGLLLVLSMRFAEIVEGH
jgi:hypothetical protein